MIEYTEIRQVDSEVLKCKALWSHAWDTNPTPQIIDGRVARMAYSVMALRCDRCARERYDYLNRDGSRIAKPYYKDPINYPKTRRHNGDEWRAELNRRNILVTRLSGRKR